MFKISLKNYSYSTFIIGLLFLYLGIVYFSIAISNIVLGVAVFTFILGVYKKQIDLNLKVKNWYLYVFIIIPFLLTLVSVLNSVNIEIGLKYLWLRFPILIIPYILLSVKIEKKSIKIGLSVFVYLTILASMVTLYNAIKYINEDILFKTEFTFFITIIQHPYLGILCLLALVSIVEFKLIQSKAIKMVVFGLLIAVIAITTSRLVYILLFLLFEYYLFKRVSIKRAIIFSTLLVIFGSVVILTNNNVASKFKRSIQYENSPRLQLWNNSYKIVNATNSTLFGIGIGDYYQNKKDPYFVKESKDGILGYNPHSQMVEFYTTNGVLGLFIWASIIIIGLTKISRKSNFAFLVFGIIVLFSLTESILSRQYGVQIYSIFIPLIFNEYFQKKRNEIL